MNYQFEKTQYCRVTTPAIRSLLLARAKRAGFSVDNANEDMFAEKSMRRPENILAFAHNYDGLRIFGFTDPDSMVGAQGAKITVQEMLDLLSLKRNEMISMTIDQAKQFIVEYLSFSPQFKS